MTHCLIAFLLFCAAALLTGERASARPRPSSDRPPSARRGVRSTVDDAGAALPRIQCTSGYTATVYAQGLSSPDGLAFSPDGVLHVAEEAAGRVSRIDPTGSASPLISGLRNPEGIAFDEAGNLYVVEDVESGRLIARWTDGLTTTLATDLDAPEGVAWAADGTLYVTESNAQFVSNPYDLRSRVTAVSLAGEVTRVITHTPTIDGTDVTFWSYAGLASGADGQLYLSNELSGVTLTRTIDLPPPWGTITVTLATTDSLFTVHPASGEQALLASDLVAPEGLRASGEGGFALYVAEEDLGDGSGRLSRVESDGSHSPICSGFLNVEDVAVDERGWLYVSEDTSGMIVLIRPEGQPGLALVLRSWRPAE